jgi:hypothetical protein
MLFPVASKESIRSLKACICGTRHCIKANSGHCPKPDPSSECGACSDCEGFSPAVHLGANGRGKPKNKNACKCKICLSCMVLMKVSEGVKEEVMIEVMLR